MRCSWPPWNPAKPTMTWSFWPIPAQERPWASSFPSWKGWIPNNPAPRPWSSYLPGNWPCRSKRSLRAWVPALRSPAAMAAIYGETEENNLLQAPALIIGTPGRLADHIRRENIHTDTIRTLVLDEFDKSLESGFYEEI